MIEPRALPSDANRVWKVTTNPLIEPITLEELKLFARIDGTDEDDLLNSFIESARRATENYLRRALINQTITMKMDWWPGRKVELPMPPLVSITAVETLDEDDTATTYSSDNYYTDTVSDPGVLYLKQGVAEPENTDRNYMGFQIRYVAGYGSKMTDVPAVIRDGIKLWATAIYENRFQSDDPPPEAVNMLYPYRFERID